MREAGGSREETFGQHWPVIRYHTNPARVDLENKLKTDELERNAVQKDFINSADQGKKAWAEYTKTKALCKKAHQKHRKLYHEMEILGKKHKHYTNKAAELENRRKELNNDIKLHNNRLDKKIRPMRRFLKKTLKN